MSFLNPWIYFLLIPIYIFYKVDIDYFDKEKKIQRKLLFLSLLMIMVSLSRPVITNSLNEEKFDAQDFIIALDASYSMQANDLKPTRYALAKQDIQTLLHAYPNNRFSIFAFTTNAMLISPPTTDTEISIIALETLNPKYILTKGTSLLNLLHTVSKTSYEKKKLIIFSDGGEDHNLQKLVKFAKENNIIPFVIATSSQKGSTLKEHGKNLKDEKGNLIITRINPILKDFANLSGGRYYELDSNSQNVIEMLIADISNNKYDDEQSKIHVLSYTELFYIPLSFALLLFFIAITKFHQIILLFLLFIFPNPVYSSNFDFYHSHEATKAYQTQQYKDATQEFLKMTPSVESYYNLGVAYYKDKQYKNAIKIFSQIKSKDMDIKQKLFYNMGNCAVKLKKYERAKIYYQKALSLSYDKQAYENLMAIYTLKEKVDISDMLPKNETNKKTEASKKTDTKKDESKTNADNSSSNQKADESTNGSAAKKGKEIKKSSKKNDKINKAQYKIGYKAYELINKGYTNEKHPW